MLTKHQWGTVTTTWISQTIPQPSFTKISLKITVLKSDSNLPGSNESKVFQRVKLLMWCMSWWPEDRATWTPQCQVTITAMTHLYEFEHYWISHCGDKMVIRSSLQTGITILLLPLPVFCLMAEQGLRLHMWRLLSLVETLLSHW